MSLYFNKQTNKRKNCLLFNCIHRCKRTVKIETSSRFTNWSLNKSKKTKQNKLGKKRIGTKKVNDA